MFTLSKLDESEKSKNQDVPVSFGEVTDSSRRGKRGTLAMIFNTFRLFLALIPAIGPVAGFTSLSSNDCKLISLRYFSTIPPRMIESLKAKTDEDDDSEDLLPERDQDWRAFRAKLVMSEKPASSKASATSLPSGGETGDAIVDDSDIDGIGALFCDSTATPATKDTESSHKFSAFTPLDPSQWAYDSGKVIEQGAVILGGVEQDFGFGLRQQYFHKAVILVLDHDEKSFTKGIILNRPSNQMMDDEINEGVKWRVWFGGDVQGLDSILPDIVCLHSLKSKDAKECSVSVMKDIQWTSFTNAKKLVQRGIASGPEDFWLFAGYAGWGPRQLAGELDRKSWYMCATDSQTLLKELARQSSGVDPRDAGLETWELLMEMIGRGETARQSKGKFDDLVLKEWGRANLLFKGGEYEDAGIARNPLWGTSGGAIPSGAVDNLMKEVAQMAIAEDISEGTLLRASSAERSPFLLQKQEFHKSLVLVILDDDKCTVGVMLNHAATKGCEFRSTLGEVSIIPLRYGGDYAVKGQSPLLWLHCDDNLRDSGVGTPFGKNTEGKVCKCSQEQAQEAISKKIAKATDFLVISGVCVWPKLGGSLATEVKRGIFEIVPESNIEGVFGTLQKQKVLSFLNLSDNIELAHAAWERSGDANKSALDDKVLTLGIGEGYDDDDDSVVFNSDKKVSELADDAKRKWIATFLLGQPTI
mmetsp:Transcript_10800/g.23000  ORF Transcript_10800/g.23000 Transcript_10800/m.23000 type:complete len:700 (-) Transcript_10800:2401-4500(-)